MGSENRRKYFRIEMKLPVRWHLLNEEEIRKVKNGMGSDLFRRGDLPTPIQEFLEQAASGSKEEQLYRSLQLVNNKLDFIIDQLLSKSAGNVPNWNDLVEISASGLKFTTEEPLHVGAYMKMYLIIPETYQYQIEFVAEVVRVSEDGNDFLVAAKIVEIYEEARDAIVRVVLEKQRKEIRRLRAHRED